MNIKLGKAFRLSFGPFANNGKPACSVSFYVPFTHWTVKIGWWCYGWENPAYYKRFDHVRFMAVCWKRNAKQSERGYGALGFDKTLVIRDNGAWLRFPRLHH